MMNQKPKKKMLKIGLGAYVGVNTRSIVKFNNGNRKIENNEIETSILQRRCLRAARNLKKGEIIKKEMFDILRPAPISSIPPYKIDDILGKRLLKDLVLGEELIWSDIQND